MREQEMTVDAFMTTALITARPQETIADVDFEMKLANVRHIPVVGAHNELVGIVSQRDLLRALAKSPKKEVPIHAVMKTRIYTVQEGDPALTAVERMLEHKIGCLPVLGEDGQLVGLVTETDFLRLAADVLRGRFRAVSRKAS
jgi:CBS domain-containing protein